MCRCRSARWTGHIQTQYTEPYVLRFRSDDGFRFWLNGRLLFNAWNDNPGANGEGTYSLNATAGEKYEIKIEYYENTGDAQFHLRWSSPSTPSQPIPRTQLYPN